jgi:hypothetical protein
MSYISVGGVPIHEPVRRYIQSGFGDLKTIGDHSGAPISTGQATASSGGSSVRCLLANNSNISGDESAPFRFTTPI